MAANDPVRDAAGQAASQKATETLSQFLARVLDQLALSAWLPSAALVLLVALVLRLGAVLDAKPPPSGPLQATGAALSRVPPDSVAGAILLVVAIVVLTMVTQAFSFEAIRLLEGYWGTRWVPERLAQARCGHHRTIRDRLRRRLKELTKQAWSAALDEINREQRALVDRGRAAEYTPNQLAVLGAAVLDETPTVELDDGERADALAIDWQIKAPPDLMRRRINLDKRLRDFPEPHRVLPTRLGNVLRRHEDDTGRGSVESLVQEVFDDLPTSLRIEHDEQRTRLDLYCSMVFIVVFTGAIAVARFGLQHWAYAAGAAVVAVASAALMYRAAVSSAQAYGGLLLIIAARADELAAATTRPADEP